MERQLELWVVSDAEKGSVQSVRRCEMCNGGGPLKAHTYKVGGKLDMMMVCSGCKALLNAERKRRSKDV